MYQTGREDDCPGAGSNSRRRYRGTACPRVAVILSQRPLVAADGTHVACKKRQTAAVSGDFNAASRHAPLLRARVDSRLDVSYNSVNSGRTH